MNFIETPIETYSLGDGHTVDVKREDLQAGGDPSVRGMVWDSRPGFGGWAWPRWGKMAQVQDYLIARRDSLLKTGLVHFTGKWSFSGWALANLCAEQGIRLVLCIPQTEDFPSVLADYFATRGAEIVRVRNARVDFMVNAARAVAAARGMAWNPYGFNVPEYYRACAARLDAGIRARYDTLVVAGGSGVTPAAYAAAFLEGMPSRRRVYVYCTGTIKTVKGVVDKRSLTGVEYVETSYKFDDLVPDVDCPFDVNELWDKKAWAWLVAAHRTRPGGRRTLFWCLGGGHPAALDRLALGPPPQ